eukprot:TRINITY_DN12323_c0_g1_i2.p1 TRINITY_DN12323_c0_g1~~TRINITY_DN12323_c0_g1_i2.p1  ORF type:complete len:108 (+),score=11.86 TRINITY_DN12323_c0_g1_i2:170-493(+)
MYVPTKHSTVEEVARWISQFEGGKFSHEAFSGIDGVDLLRAEKSDFQSFLGVLGGASLYSVLHPLSGEYIFLSHELSSLCNPWRKACVFFVRGQCFGRWNKGIGWKR